MSNAQQLTMSICGEFITDTAREQYHYEHNLSKAIEILMSATENDQMTESEHIAFCMEILAGKKDIVGTYPGDDYNVVDNESVTDKNGMRLFLETIQKELDSLYRAKDEYQDLIQKYCFVLDNLEDYELRNIDRNYRAEYGRPLFKNNTSNVQEFLDNNTYIQDAVRETQKSPMLEAFLHRMSYSDELQDTDYGWLEPNGTFHAVPWGDHWKWADKWLKANRPLDKYPELYGETKSEQLHNMLTKPGDVMIYKLNWVLMHSPSQGTAVLTHGNKPLTKAQKEYLYDYYIKRNMHAEANALYADE